MSSFKHRLLTLGAVCLVACIPAAHAQMAVIDAASVAHLAQQLTAMAQQLTTLQGSLRQAQAQYQSLIGDRGMENLLSGVSRNYLPPDWSTLLAVAGQTSNAYPALSSAIQSSVGANAVLTAQQVAALSPAERAQLTAQRQSTATLQATSQQALATASSRFALIQQLIAAIATAHDPKAILDLQARISAEQGMLANDQTKLQVLYQASQAQQWALAQRGREQSITDIGSLRTLPAMGL
jgi:type IV secretion system protein VirB5